jgi:hypothetical protein
MQNSAYELPLVLTEAERHRGRNQGRAFLRGRLNDFNMDLPREADQGKMIML